MRLTQRGKRRLLILFAFFGVVGLAVAGVVIFRDVYQSRNAARARATGLDAYARGEYETALIDLRYPLNRTPDDVEVLLAIAGCRAKVTEVGQRHLREAETHYRRVLQVEPANPIALERLLKLYGRLGESANGEEIADRILEIDENNIDALAAKCVIILRGPGPDPVAIATAETLARRLMAIEPETLNWYKFLLETRRRAGDDSEILLSQCQSWIDSFEGDGRFYLLKSEFLIGLGRIEDARAAAVEAARRGAASGKVLDLMLGVLDAVRVRQGDHPELAAARVALLDMTRSEFSDQPWVYDAIVRQHWRASRLDAARAELEVARANLMSLDDRLLRWDALLLVSEGRHDDALAVVDRLIAIADASPAEARDANRGWAEALGARLMADEVGWPTVIDRLRRAIDLIDRDPILLYLLAGAYQSMGEHELAVQVCARAMQVDEMWMAPFVADAKSLLTLGRSDEAIDVLVDAIRRMPSAGTEPYLLLAEAWLNSTRPISDVAGLRDGNGQPVSLLALLETLRTQSPSDARIVDLLVRTHLQADDREGGRRLLEEELSRENVSSSHLLTLARLAQAVDVELATRLVDRADAMGGVSGATALARADLLLRQNRLDDALRLVEQTLNQDSHDPDDRKILTRQRAALLARGGRPEAPAALRAVLEDDPDSHDAAIFVLAVEGAWSDRSLIEAAIDQLGRSLGAYSPRVVLVRATFTMRFEAGDPARMAASMRQVSQVLKVSPSSLPALTLMAELLLTDTAPDAQQAVRYLRRAADQYPRQWGLYPRLISVLQGAGEFELAENYLRRFGRRPNSNRSLWQAERGLLEAQGDFETLVLRLESTIGDRSSAREQLDLAQLHERVGQFDDAERIYQGLLETESPDDRVVGRVARFYVERQRPEEALALVQGHDPAAGEAIHELMIANLHQVLGDPATATTHFQRAVELDGDDPAIITQFARHLLANNEVDRSLQLARQGVAAHADDEQLNITLAAGLLRGDENHRREALGIIADLGPDHVAWLTTETLNDRVSRTVEAGPPRNRDLADARALVLEHDEYMPAWRLAVTMHARAGLEEESIQLARDAMAKMPARAEPAEWATQMLINARRPTEALEAARTWRRRAISGYAGIDTVIASLLLDRGRFDEALAALRPHESSLVAQLQRHPERATVWLRILLHVQQFERGRELMEASATCREAWARLAGTLEEDRTREALLYVQPLMIGQPGEALLLAHQWMALARRIDSPGDYARALVCAEAADLDADLHLNVLTVQAEVAMGGGDYATAEMNYRSALELQPGHPGILNNLAYTLLQRDPRSSEALLLASQAVRIDPANPDLLDTYAQTLLGAGRLDEALVVITQAVGARETDPALRITRVLVLIEQERFEEGRTELAEARRYLNAQTSPDGDLRSRMDELQQRLDASRAASAS